MKRLHWLALVAIAIVIAPDLYQFAGDWRQIKDIAREIGDGETDPHVLALRVDRAMTAHVRKATRESEWYRPADRPIFRHRAMETYRHREGACGEVARLMINALQALGVSAHRIILYGARNEFHHVAVMYEVAERKYLLPGLVSYNFRDWALADRRTLAAMIPMGIGNGAALWSQAENPFFDDYSFLNWSRIFKKWIKVSQYVPFPDWVTMVLENPPLLKAMLKLIAILALLAITSLVMRVGRHKRVKGPVF